MMTFVAATTAMMPASAAAQRFEGIITMQIDGTAARAASRGAGERGNSGRGDGARGNAANALRNAFATGMQQIEYMTRRGKVRIALGGNGGPAPAAMIYAPDEGVVYTLLPGVSMYAEMPLADLAMASASASSDSGARATSKAPTVTHTKQFELIAGHRCEHALFISGKQKTDICMAKGLGVFVMPAVAGAAAGWDKVLVAENGFPLKVVQPDGSVLMEVVRIERQALGEALFSVPDSYSRMPDPTRRPPG